MVKDIGSLVVVEAVLVVVTRHQVSLVVVPVDLMLVVVKDIKVALRDQPLMMDPRALEAAAVVLVDHHI